MSKEGIFYGAGQQNGRSHAVVEAKGNRAQEFYNWIITKPSIVAGEWYCTRIDLQVTKPGPDAYDPHKAYTRLRKPKGLHLSDTGNTLYVGSRKSDSFWRIYDKTPELLRVEIELKGKQAKRAFVGLLNGLNMGGIWNQYMLRSRIPKVLVDRYQTAEEPTEAEPIEDVEDMQKKLDWLKTLDSLVFKLANDHDTANETAVLISSWTVYCTKT
jgi:hypothetical protein